MSSRLDRKPSWILAALLLALAVLSQVMSIAHPAPRHITAGIAIPDGHAEAPISFYVNAAGKGYVVGTWGSKQVAITINCANIWWDDLFDLHRLYASGKSSLGTFYIRMAESKPIPRSDFQNYGSVDLSRTPGPYPCGGAFDGGTMTDRYYGPLLFVKK